MHAHRTKDLDRPLSSQQIDDPQDMSRVRDTHSLSDSTLGAGWVLFSKSEEEHGRNIESPLEAICPKFQ